MSLKAQAGNLDAIVLVGNDVDEDVQVDKPKADEELEVDGIAPVAAGEDGGIPEPMKN